jgi:hypothetical protein
MDLPGPPARAPGATRAPASGLKLMLAILVVFALLAGYGKMGAFSAEPDRDGHDHSCA